MTPERQKLAFEIFDAAIERPAAERERFVALKCTGDPELFAEVRSMLATHADAAAAGGWWSTGWRDLAGLDKQRSIRTCCALETPARFLLTN